MPPSRTSHCQTGRLPRPGEEQDQGQDSREEIGDQAGVAADEIPLQLLVKLVQKMDFSRMTSACASSRAIGLPTSKADAVVWNGNSQ